jgi:hypothetical protein
MTERRRITVLTLEDQPVFSVAADLTAKQIDLAVAALYGTQPNGLPHNWIGEEARS